LKGAAISLLTKTSKRYEGVIISIRDGEGDKTGVTLFDVKEVTAPNAPVKSVFFIASTNIESWYPLLREANKSVSPLSPLVR
jgi:hypothetical protein